MVAVWLNVPLLCQAGRALRSRVTCPQWPLPLPLLSPQILPWVTWAAWSFP